MLEIDGEYFEDPCELIKIGRQLIALSVVEMAIVQIGSIFSQPLFPLFSPKGGIVNTNICKGDIVHPTLWDMEDR